MLTTNVFLAKTTSPYKTLSSGYAQFRENKNFCAMNLKRVRYTCYKGKGKNEMEIVSLGKRKLELNQSLCCYI